MSVHVLLVDDSPEIIKILGEMYGSIHGVRVVGVARTCDEAIKVLGTNTVDIISIDIHMGILGGYDFCRMVRRRYPNVYITMCSADAGPEAKRTAYMSGADYFITKPAGVEDIADMLQQYYMEHPVHRG